ncbi:MAG: peptidoglycan-binding protein, partial [Thermoplasmatota archaeon]
MIRARQLGRRFGGRRVIDRLDLDVERGAFVLVTGPNGSGKTTLLSRLLAHPAVGKPATSAPPRKPVRHNPFPAPSSTLRPGARGDVVRWVQWAVGVPVDGVWGAQTTSAVKYFQHQHRLVDDGVVGP